MLQRLLIGNKLLSAFACAMAIAASGPAVARGDAITDWNTIAMQAELNAKDIIGQIRTLPMVNLAQFDAIDSIEQKYQEYSRYGSYLPNAAGADETAAADQAAYSVLSNLVPSQQATFNSALASQLAAIPDGQAKTAGIALGNAAAARVIALRANDHYSDTVPYTPGNAPGNWRPTGSAQSPAINTQWPYVTPFSIPSGSVFRNPIGPPPITSAAFAAAVNQVKDLGSANSTTRTPDQTNIAKFWYLSPATTNSVPGIWNRIAQTVEQTHPLNLLDNARLFALLNMGQLDVFVATNDDKFSYNFWRPETAIHLANTTGMSNSYTNPGIVGDPNWTPLLPAPAFPSYVSNHAGLDGSAAAVLASVFQTDNISFTASTQGFSVPDRSFTSFSQASEEGAMSRIYAGIHYPFDSADGLTLGNQVGNYMTRYEFLPVSTPEPGSALVLGAGCILFLRRRRCSRGSA